MAAYPPSVTFRSRASRWARSASSRRRSRVSRKSRALPSLIFSRSPVSACPPIGLSPFVCVVLYPPLQRSGPPSDGSKGSTVRIRSELRPSAANCRSASWPCRPDRGTRRARPAPIIERLESLMGSNLRPSASASDTSSFPSLSSRVAKWRRRSKEAPRATGTVGRVLRALQAHDGRLAETPANFIRVYEPKQWLAPWVLGEPPRQIHPVVQVSGRAAPQMRDPSIAIHRASQLTVPETRKGEVNDPRGR